MNSNWTINENDREIAEQLKDFLPSLLFDMHMHVYRKNDLNLESSDIASEGPNIIGISDIDRFYTNIFSHSSLAGGLAIGYPTKNCVVKALNQDVSQQIVDKPSFKGLMCITPYDNCNKIRSFLDKNEQIIGFKPYHVFSKKEHITNLSVLEFLPEWAFQIAHERNLIITLHIVKDSAIADPQNQNDIITMCKKYPKAQLILAHAARCFFAPNAKKGLSSLIGLENVWFDSSAICEPEPLKEILCEFGPKKLMWGSDFPVCMIRGKAVTLGLNFFWIQPDTVLWEQAGTGYKPVLVGLESLRAMESACSDIGLGKEQIEDIFKNNAKRMLFEM